MHVSAPTPADTRACLPERWSVMSSGRTHGAHQPLANSTGKAEAAGHQSPGRVLAVKGIVCPQTRAALQVWPSTEHSTTHLESASVAHPPAAVADERGGTGTPRLPAAAPRAGGHPPGTASVAAECFCAAPAVDDGRLRRRPHLVRAGRSATRHRGRLTRVRAPRPHGQAAQVRGGRHPAPLVHRGRRRRPCRPRLRTRRTGRRRRARRYFPRHPQASCAFRDQPGSRQAHAAGEQPGFSTTSARERGRV
jgi:hypothetical protein